MAATLLLTGICIGLQDIIEIHSGQIEMKVFFLLIKSFYALASVEMELLEPHVKICKLPLFGFIGIVLAHFGIVLECYFL